MLPLSFIQQCVNNLLDAKDKNNAVLIQMPWGCLEGIPVSSDRETTEIAHFHDPGSETWEDGDPISKTVWILKTEDIVAVSVHHVETTTESLEEVFMIDDAV